MKLVLKYLAICAALVGLIILSEYTRRVDVENKQYKKMDASQTIPNTNLGLKSKTEGGN